MSRHLALTFVMPDLIRHLAPTFVMPDLIRHLVCLTLLAILAVPGWAFDYHKPLTFEDRVKAQEAIERVYYNHRIWPKENPGPKPPFEELTPRATIEAKVTDYLKKGSALKEYWQRPITAEQLQAEMDRMVKGTKDPETLKELFAALGNDPYQAHGHTAHKEHILIEGVPVQLIPAYNPLVQKAMESARDVKFKRINTHVVEPEYLMAIMLQTGRPKDRARLVLFLEEAEFDKPKYGRIIKNHGLKEKWDAFQREYKKD